MELGVIIFALLIMASLPLVFELGRRYERRKVAEEKQRIAQLTAVEYPHRQRTRRSVANPDKSPLKPARMRGRRRKKF